MIRFSALVAELGDARAIGQADPLIEGVAHDSREARRGFLFVAVPGFHVDGHDYIAKALAAGAAGVIVQADQEARWWPAMEDSPAPAIAVPDTRVALARAAAAVHGHPARRLKVIGITGTDGKTSLANLVAHLLDSAGEKAGLISTAECRIGETALMDTGRFTTPEAPQVQSMLARMVDATCSWAVIEATSHGLALHRVDECEYDIAVMTNLGLDHLDFHGSPEAYRAAKGRLFEMLDRSLAKGIEKTAVLNGGENAYPYFASLTSARKIDFSEWDPLVNVWGSDFKQEAWSVIFELTVQDLGWVPNQYAKVNFPKPGYFSVSNALAAVGVGLAAGLSLEQIVAGLESWPGAPGRMQLLDEGQPFLVVVDFAHAPDSLRRVLRLLRETAGGRVIAVFGCIGERDKDRRAGMGRVAAEEADYAIVTDDNPYSEDRMRIIEQVAAALRAAGRREGHDFAVVPDRREAIAQALAMAVDEDAVLLAGKGHEREVHLPDGVYECHDEDVARTVLRELRRPG